MTADVRLDSEVSTQGQQVNCTQLWRVHTAKGVTHKVRLKLRSDSYVDQSYAYAQVWDGKQWQELYALQPANMLTPTKLAYGPKRATVADFDADISRLLSLSRTVLA